MDFYTDADMDIDLDDYYREHTERDDDDLLDECPRCAGCGCSSCLMVEW